MGLLESSNGKSGILTAVFASIFLVSIGFLTHDVFADQASATQPAPSSVPLPPANLTATGDYAQVTLSWTDVNNDTYQIKSYSVYRGTTPGGEISTPLATGITSTTYNDTGLANGQTYYYTVRAVNSLGTSSPSNEASATPIGPPTAPTGLVANSVSPSQINLSWNAPSSNGGSKITAYKIQRSPDDSTWATIATTSPSQMTYSDAGLTSSTTFYYRVAATNTIGTGPPSNTAYATTESDVIFGSSSPSSTTVSNVTAGSVVISPSYNDYYEGEKRILPVGNALFAFYYSLANDNILYQTSTDGGNTWNNAVSAGTGQVSSDVKRFGVVTTTTSDGINHIVLLYYASPGTSSTFYAKRGNVTGTSITWNSPTALFSAANPDYCGVGDCAGAVGSTDTSGNVFAAFRWNAPSGGYPSAYYHYGIFESSDGGLTWKVSLPDTIMGDGFRNAMTLAELGGGKMLFVNALYGATEVNYQVFNGTSWSSSSTTSGSGLTMSQKQISSASDSAHDALVAFISGGNPGALRMATWNGTTGLIQSLETADSTLLHSLPSITIYAGMIHIYSLSAGKIYDTVKANGTWHLPANPFGTNLVNPDELTAAASYPAAVWLGGIVPSPAIVPSPPTGLAASTISSSQINLSWAAPSNNGGSVITGYKIERLQGNSTTWATIVSSTGSTATTYSDTRLAASTTYAYRISAINSVGTSQPSNTTSAATLGAATVPDAPTGLITTGGNSQVTLSWAAPSNNGGSEITNYIVYRGTSSGNETLLAQIGDATSYDDAKVTDSQTYYYKVAAVNSVGASLRSNEASATPLAITTIPVNGAYGVAVNPSTNMVYVANGWQSHIQVINGTTNMITANVTTASDPGYAGCDTGTVAVNPVTNIVYANNGACVFWPPSSVPDWIPGKLFVINGTTNTVITTVTLDSPQSDGSSSLPLAVNPATDKIYVVPTLNGVIDVVNGNTNQLGARISLTSSPAYDIAANPKTNTIYVLGGNVTYVINGATDSIVKSFSWGKFSTNGIGVNPNTNRIYISNSDKSISVIDGSTYQLIANIPSISYGFVSVNPSTDKIYVGDVAGGDHVAVLDGQTNTLASQVQVGQKPYGIGISTNTNKIYVGNSASSTVSLFDGNFMLQDFALVSLPQSQSIQAGGYSNSTVTADSLGGFSGTVSFSSSAPSSLSASLNPSSVTVPSGGSASSLLGISVAPSATSALYTITVTGTNGSVTHTTAINVFVLTVPSPPQNLKANAISSSQVCMNWYPPANSGGYPVTAYNIEGSTNNGTTWYSVISDMNSPDAANPSWCDSNQTPNTAYTYRVFAINSLGTSQPSNTASATTLPTISSAPAGLTAKAISMSQINLSWSAPSNNGGSAIAGYAIQRSTDNGSTWSALVATSSNSTTYSDTGLAANTTYAYRVSAINSAGTSQPSNTASATTPATISSAPTGLTATGISPTGISLSWSAPTNNGGSAVTGYKIMMSTDGSSFTTLVNDTNNGGTTYSTSGLHPHTTYYFEVSAINSVGTSALSNIASAATR